MTDGSMRLPAIGDWDRRAFLQLVGSAAAAGAAPAAARQPSNILDMSAVALSTAILVTLSGCPALAVPAGFGPGKLPIGLQIIAPVHQELACLTMGAAYEAAGSWTNLAPPLAAVGR